MSFYDAIRVGASGASRDLEIDRSLRFNDGDSAYLNRTFGSAGNRKTYTISAWVKISNLGSTRPIFSRYTGNSDSGFLGLYVNSDDFIYFTGWGTVYLKSSRIYRDPTAWSHIVLAVDTTQSTSTDRIKLYFNGELQSTATYNAPSQDADLVINEAVEHRIGNYHNVYFDGYMAEVNFVDGLQLAPNSFAKTDEVTGQWIPQKYVGAYGTNGFRLTFADNSGTTATTLGKDESGNGNNFTPNNFAVSDAVKDTPTNNFCTLNPLNKTNDVDLRKGNLEFFQSSNDESATATFGITSGKWYWEVYKNSSENPELGIEVVTRVLSNKTDDVSPTKVCIRTNGGDQQVGTGTPQSITGSSGGLTGAGVLAIAVDFDNKKIWYSDLSGNFFNSGNPATGANAAFTFSSVAVADECIPYFFCGTGGNNSFNINFGQDGTFAGHTTAGGYADGNGHGNFKYSVPSGYLALCSANLPDPSIKLPDKYFDTVLYSGTGSSQNITGLEFQPDWVWIKKRSNSENHEVQDSVRGATKRLASNTNDQESTVSGSISSFNSDGFTVVDAGTTNENGHTYVAWTWKAGGSASSNSDGSITSSVSANTSAGFSIVTYTGTGSQTTVGHGLGVKPKVIITKLRDTNTQDWFFYPKQITGTGGTYIKLNTNDTVATDAHTYPDVEPTSTVYTVGGNDGGDGTNGNGKAYVAYCFSEVAGYSKFGKYTGNGSANGTFIFTGFRPAWFVVRRTDASNNWRTFDAKRSTFNEVDKRIYLDTSNAESTGSDIDFLSNGVKMRMTDSGMNASGGTYIYLAFAEAPFRNARAR